MCKSVAEGGQRCAAHTRARLSKIADKVQAAIQTGDHTAIFTAREEWIDAAAEYASTTEGHQHFTGLRDQSATNKDYDTAAMLNTVVNKGDAIRAANKETAALINAVRMSENTDPEDFTEKTMQTTPVQIMESNLVRDEWEQSVQKISELVAQAKNIQTGIMTLTTETITEDLNKVTEGYKNPLSTDEELANCMHLASYYSRLQYVVPQPIVVMSKGATQNYQKEWSKVTHALNEAHENYAQQILGHPNAGPETFSKYMQFGDENVAALHPNIPRETLKEFIQLSSGNVNAKVWERVRDERMEDNSLAMLSAVYEPDALQREDAAIQMSMTGMETLTKKDRAWLAKNLENMPGSSISQTGMAESLISWAKFSTDMTERRHLFGYLQASRNPDVAALGLEATLEMNRAMQPVKPEPVKRRWFG